MSNQNPIYADMRNVQYSNSLKAVPSTSNASNALQPKFTQLPTNTPDASLAQYYPMDKTHGTIPQLRPQGAKSNAVVPILDQERFLPIANVSRIMKQMIPSTGKIAKEAKECVQECVSEFISFITSEASDRCIAEKRKTISADDLLEAMVSLGFDNYIEPMTIMLHRYRTVHKLSSNVGRTDRFSDPFHLAPLGPPGQPRVSHAEPPAMSEPPPTLTRVSSSIPVFDSKSVVGQVPDRKRNEIHQISQMAGGSYGMRSGMHNSSVEQPTHTTGSVPHSVNRAPPAVSHAAAAVPHPSQPSPGQQQVPADAVALEQSNVQIYVDPITKQHYIAVESAEGGTQLFPITIQGGPVATITDGEENTIQEQQQHQQYMMVQGENDHVDQQPQQLSHQGAMTYSTGHVSSRGDTNGSCVQQKTFSSDKPPVLEAEGGPVRTQRRLTNNRPAPYKGKQ